MDSIYDSPRLDPTRHSGFAVSQAAMNPLLAIWHLCHERREQAICHRPEQFRVRLVAAIYHSQVRHRGIRMTCCRAYDSRREDWPPCRGEPGTGSGTSENRSITG